MIGTPNISTSTEIEVWFKQFIEEVEFAQLKLETGIASNELKKAFEILSGGNLTEIHQLNAQMAEKFFIAQIIQDFLKLTLQIPLKKLAFAPDHSKVLVWVEIDDDDEIAERAIIMAEAKINAQYHPYGWVIDIMILETSDELSVPTNYQTIKRPNFA